MPIKFIGRAAKKVLTIAGAIVGIGNGALVAGEGSIGIGQIITGQIIVDIVLIVGCLAIIAINGKDGVPDWLVELVGKKVDKK